MKRFVLGMLSSGEQERDARGWEWTPPRQRPSLIEGFGAAWAGERRVWMPLRRRDESSRERD